MKTSKPNESDTMLRNAIAYLNKINDDPTIQVDFVRLHKYIMDIRLRLYQPSVPAEVVRTMARLYFESSRYQDAEDMLQRLNDPALNEMRINNDFYNGYFATSFHWAARQDVIWKDFNELQAKLASSSAASVAAALKQLKQRWDACFPANQMVPAPPQGGDKGTLVLGNPNGIFSIYPMVYLQKHVPAAVSRRWTVKLEDPDAQMDGYPVLGRPIWGRDVLVRIVPSTFSPAGGKVDLQVWHPVLEDLLADGKREAPWELAVQMASTWLPLTALTLYVGQITAIEQKPSGEDTVPLPKLKRWFQDRDMAPDLPPEQILASRRQSFTREPAAVARPRADIIRGETCMPELEEIYFLRNGKGASALQRYGVSYWFLTIPKHACTGDFQTLRQRLEEHVLSQEEDKVFFTGWAEGTDNNYIDFLSLDGAITLNTLRDYLPTLPGGRDIRISSFYWNCTLRSMNFTREMIEMNSFEMGYFAKFPLEPPKALASAADRAALEKAFRETQWASASEEPQAANAVQAFPYEKAMESLQEAQSHILRCNVTDEVYDFVLLHRCLREATPPDDAPDASEAFCNALGMVLMSMERYRESIKWLSRTSPSDKKIVQLYTCNSSSDYPNGFHHLESRRQIFWRDFAALEPGLTQYLSGSGKADALDALKERLDEVFPSQEVTLAPAGAGKKKTLRTGLPDGMLTLPAMLYFCSHYPASVGKGWTIAVSGDAQLPAFVSVNQRSIPSREIRVSLTEQDGKVSLALWHPQLSLLALGKPQEAGVAAAKLINEALPMGARLLYVTDITALAEEPAEFFPLPELQQQMKTRGFPLDISLEALLNRRRYTISRTPKDTGRPRDDIVRGETCMPELERIYNRLYEEGQAILDRYGTYALSLMIPNDLCAGDPARYRQQLTRTISLACGDQVFFTGWAEGTQYCYLDLMVFNGPALLAALYKYAIGAPGGKRLKLCAYFWDSVPRSWYIMDVMQESSPDNPALMLAHAKAHTPPEFPVPDAAAAAAFEASFRPAFTPADFAAPKPAASAGQNTSSGKKKLSKAQRNALNNKNSKSNKGGKNKKKR